jgi:complex iron-sulfur molybdoenzyme family reductase subunit gamma
MTLRQARFPLLLTAAALLSGAGFAAYLWPHPSSGAAAPVRGDAEVKTDDKRLSPATNLRIHAAAFEEKIKTLLDPGAAAWKDAAPTNVLLNRTPRVYQTEPPFAGKIPGLEVRAVRAGGKLVVRLEWDDATKNAPEAPPRKTGEAGDPDKLYKRPTGETSQFADAAAVMVPEQWTGPGFPSLQMGDAKNPVRIFYWNASRGAEELAASGRATPKPSGRAFAHRAEHAADKWRVTLELPDQADGTPAAFAVWDGASDDRDGLKFVSIWYVLTAQ